MGNRALSSLPASTPYLRHAGRAEDKQGIQTGNTPPSSANAPHPQHDRQLLRMLEDSYREFENAVKKNKQPSSYRKMLKDYRCHQAMVAALNFQTPSLNLRYCDGLRELDALLKSLQSTPGASVHRAVTRVGGGPHLALEIRKNAEGNITILALDSVRPTERDSYHYKKLAQLIDSYTNIQCIAVPLCVQHTMMDCPIHSMYLLQQLHKHPVELPELSEQEKRQKIFFKSQKYFDFHVDVYGLMDKLKTYRKLEEQKPDIGTAKLSGIDIPLETRIASNTRQGHLGNDPVEYADSAELYRLELYRQTIDWVASTPQREVNFEMNKVRPVRAGHDWLKRFPLTTAKPSTGQNAWQSVDARYLANRDEASPAADQQPGITDPSVNEEDEPPASSEISATRRES